MAPSEAASAPAYAATLPPASVGASEATSSAKSSSESSFGPSLLSGFLPFSTPARTGLKEEKAAERSLRGGDLDPKRREEIIEHLKRSFAMTPDDIQELRKQMTDRLKDHEDGFDKKDKKKDEDL